MGLFPPLITARTARSDAVLQTFKLEIPLSSRKLGKSASISSINIGQRSDFHTITPTRLQKPFQKSLFPLEFPRFEPLRGLTSVYFSSQAGSCSCFPRRFSPNCSFDVSKDDSRLLGLCAGYGPKAQETALFIAERLSAALYRHIALKNTESASAALTASYAECTELLRCSDIDVNRSGTDCLSLLQVEKTIICANVGGIRAVVGRKKRGIWSVYQLSWDYGSDSALEKKRIFHSGVPKPGLEVLTLTPIDHFVLIATRGLWAVMSSIEAVRFAGEMYEKEAEAVPEKLVQEAQRRWGKRGKRKDDVAVGIVLIDRT